MTFTGKAYKAAKPVVETMDNLRNPEPLFRNSLEKTGRMAWAMDTEKIEGWIGNLSAEITRRREELQCLEDDAKLVSVILAKKKNLRQNSTCQPFQAVVY